MNAPNDLRRPTESSVYDLTLAAGLVALAVAASPLNIPVGVSKCFPVQSLINVLAAVWLGPWYALSMAFCTSLIRNLLGTGSLLAFPGSMVGALLAGLLYRRFHHTAAACLGEVVGTGLIGAMLSYPLALLLMGNAKAALFGFVIPFGVSGLGGAALAAGLLVLLGKSGALRHLEALRALRTSGGSR